MKILFSAEQIKSRVKILGEQISRDYKGKDLTAVCILKGSCIFFADLVREISSDVTVTLEFMSVASYGQEAVTSGEVKLLHDLSVPAEGRHILIVEDIIDTGITLSYLKKLLSARAPASLKICALLDKKQRRQTDLQADYVGFDCPDTFVAGYGLDYSQRHRNLPAICEV